MKYLVVFSFLLTFIACKKEDKVAREIAEIPINFDVERFDLAFSEATPETLPELKKDFPFLFPAHFPDSVWVNRLSDTIQLELSNEVKKAYPNFVKEKNELKVLFQHLTYYFPSFKTPTVITLTSDVDFKNKVMVTPDKLLIALDNYLGENHHFYVGIPAYIKSGMNKESLLVDVAGAYAAEFTPKATKRSFLASMVYYGKLLYLKDMLLPKTADYLKIGYTDEQLAWAEANEDQIWRFFIEKEMLYDTDPKLKERFINLAPFSKFGLQLDNESPPQLGQYIGWQIVRQFTQKNTVSLPELLVLDEETLFKQSNFKPRKP